MLTTGTGELPAVWVMAGWKRSGAAGSATGAAWAARPRRSASTWSTPTRMGTSSMVINSTPAIKRCARV
jgi:hypothetical protein